MNDLLLLAVRQGPAVVVVRVIIKIVLRLCQVFVGLTCSCNEVKKYSSLKCKFIKGKCIVFSLVLQTLCNKESRNVSKVHGNMCKEIFAQVCEINGLQL